METVWTYETGSPISGCPAVIPGKPGPLLVIGTDLGEVIALDGRGDELWRDEPGAIMHGWPVDTGAGIAVGDNRGTVHEYSHEGKPRWRTSVGNIERALQFNSGIAPWTGIARLHGEEAGLVVTDKMGRASGLKATGELLWQTHLTEPEVICCVGKPAVGDLDGDGEDEVVVSAFGGRAHCLKSDGSWLWSTSVANDGGYHAPLIMDWGDGPRVLVQGQTQGTIRCLDGEGDELWHQNTGGAVGIHVGMAPVQIDGGWRIFVSHCRTGQCLLDVEGNMIWSRDYAGGSGEFGPSVADVDGDGEPEFLLVRREFPVLRILDLRGDVKATFDMGGSFDGAPLIADLDGDGVLEFVILNSKTGLISALRFEGSHPGGKVQWPSARGPFDGRASVGVGGGPFTRGKGQHRVPEREMELDLGTDIATGSRPFAWRTGAAAAIDTAVVGPDGVRHGYPRKVGDGIHGHIDAVLDGEHTITGAGFDNEGNRVAFGNSSFDFKTFAFEKNRARILLGELEETRGRVAQDHPSAAQDVSRQVDLAGAEWSSIAGRFGVEDAEILVGEVGRLLKRLERLAITLGRAEDLRSSIEGPVEFLAWQPVHPWVTFSPSTDVPPGDILRSIHVTTDRGGHEATVLEFSNATSKAISLRLWVDGWLREGKAESPGEVPADDAITLRKQVYVATARRSMTPDALPRLDEAGLLAIPAGESARLWIDWGGGEAGPGVYRSKLHVRALTVAGQVMEFPIRWEISSLQLPEKSPLMFHVWAYEGRGVPFTEAVYRDLIEHHVNVFDLPVPSAEYTSDGLLGELDWTETDRVIRRVPAGSFFLWHGGEGIVKPGEGAQGIGSEAWRSGFEAYVHTFIGGLRERGLGYDSHANYIIDEPGGAGGERVDLHVRVARLFLSIDPDIRIFANPAGGATDEHIERILEVSHILDPIWVYSDTWGLYDHLPHILEHAPVVWTYACGDGAKDQTRMEYYWAPIWVGTQLGLTGIGFWSYAGRSVDMWQGPLEIGCDWELVYPGNGSVIPSHRWQGLRLGVEDYMRLVMVREAADDARERGDESSAAEIMSRREKLIARVVDGGHDEGTVADVRTELRGLLLAAMVDANRREEP